LPSSSRFENSMKKGRSLRKRYGLPLQDLRNPWRRAHSSGKDIAFLFKVWEIHKDDRKLQEKILPSSSRFEKSMKIGAGFRKRCCLPLQGLRNPWRRAQDSGKDVAFLFKVWEIHEDGRSLQEKMLPSSSR
jgi:hypothetical protein